MKIPFRPGLHLAAYSGYFLGLADTAKNVAGVL